MSLEVSRATEDTALRAAVGGLVCMDPLVCTETTLVGQQHLAYLASLGKNTKKAYDIGGVEWEAYCHRLITARGSQCLEPGRWRVSTGRGWVC